MRKSIIAISVAAAFATTAHADLPAKANLSIDQGVKLQTTFTAPNGTVYKTDFTQGSWFSMDANGDGDVTAGEVTPIGGLNGVIADGVTLQGATGSHGGTPGCTFDAGPCSVGFVPAVVDDPDTPEDETAAAVPGVNFTEAPDIDNPWLFFSNTGMHQTTSAVDSLTDDGAGAVTLDFSGWNVTWNGIASIPMGGDPANFPPADNTGIADMTCYTSLSYDNSGVPTQILGDVTDCVAGAAYILNHKANVPLGDASGFGGVPYVLHLEGTISDANLEAPSAGANPLLAAVAPNLSTVIDLAGNVSDPDGVDNTSFIITYTGTRDPVPTIVDDGAGSITYTDNEGTDTVTADTFTYTVEDTFGKVSASFGVEVDVVTGNISPIAQDFPVNANVGQSILVDVVANSSDSDGVVDASTVNAFNATNGTINNVDATTGVVTFTPSTVAPASFQYTVKDDSGDVATETSNVGTVTINVNALPVAVDDGPVDVERNSVVGVLINVTANDTDFEDTTVDKTTVAVPGGLTTVNGGTLSIDGTTGDITYIPQNGFLNADSFDYTVQDSKGATSLPATVSINVVNALPVAVNDTASIDTASATFVDIDVTSNDSDADGGLVVSSVSATQPADGSTSVDGSGIVTYIPNGGFIGSDQFTYTVSDVDSGVSNVATVTVNVSNSGVSVLDPAETLSFGPGIINGQVVPASGSYFTMEVSPGTLTFVALTSFNGVQLGTIQRALAATPNIDAPWLFFGNVGVDQTTTAPTILSDDGAGNVTLDFTGWDVSWNGIPSIPLNARAHSGGVDGVAVMDCGATCLTGDTYVLDYFATVPAGDPSGFGNVKYHLHLNGTLGLATTGGDAVLPPTVATIDAVDASGTAVTVQPGDTAASVGNTSGVGLTTNDIGKKDPLLNKDDGQQCVGGCVDFFVTGIVPGSYADLSFYLTEAIPAGAVYRKLMNGIWQGFDESAGDQVGSDVDTGGLCQPADGQFAKGLKAGNQCVFLRIFDGGPNDADGIANGTIVDPSGVLLSGSSNSPSSSTNGCSITRTPVKLTDRADWLIVAGFIVLMGLVSFKRRRKNS